MSALIDLSGKRFDRLTVVGRDENTPNGQAAWRCACDCGAFIRAAGGDLRNGKTKSCGCLKAELIGDRSETHGNTKGRARTVEYDTWLNMIKRCSPEAPEKDRRIYFDRGIAVCDRWRNDFSAFLSDMGLRPVDKTSIDRIDNDRGYSPGNCRWADWHEQRMNQRGMAHAGHRD